MKLIYGLKRIAKSFLENFKEPVSYPHVSTTSKIASDAVVYAPERLYIGENSSIGVGSVIMNTRADVHIGKHFVSGPKLTIITGDHMPIIGRFLDTVTDADKDLLDVNRSYDQDVVIKDDVWTGVGVTIMKGVTISRGCIVAAGSVVTRSLPPYCVGGGVPAKSLKIRWSIDQILEHEDALYPVEERYTRVQLEDIFKDIKIG